MLLPRLRTSLPLALSLGMGLTLGITTNLGAQTGGPGLSSGSGEGTGTGSSSAIGRNPSGSVSGVGPGPASGPGGPRDRALPPGRVSPADMGVSAGPGIGVTFPDDISLFPFSENTARPGGELDGLSSVLQTHLDNVRHLDKPSERSLGLQRLSLTAISSNQLVMAHTALVEASQAATLEPSQMVHDQCLIAIITSYVTLAEAHLREGKVDLSLPDFSVDAKSQPKTDRSRVILRANAEWQRGAGQAGLIFNPTYRSEMLYRVVLGMAYGSQTIVNDFTPNPQAAGSAQPAESFAGAADKILSDAAVIARRIERPVWRDRGLVEIASAAAASRQFARGLEIARTIPQPEVRTDALVRLAEAQSRRQDPDGATISYREAAQAVASIPLDDPRAVLTGVLIDNLISVGRFEDARASIVMYSDADRQLTALGAIADSQGRRGVADSARAWIMRDVRPEYRAQLLRRVNDGIMWAIGQNRSRELSPRDR
jgi:hypothetical protein